MAYRSRRARRQTGVDVQINRDLIVFDGDRDWRRRLMGDDVIVQILSEQRAQAQLAIGLSLGTRRKICEDLVALAICDGLLDDAELELLEIFAQALRVNPLQIHDALARLDRALD